MATRNRNQTPSRNSNGAHKAKKSKEDYTASSPSSTTSIFSFMTSPSTPKMQNGNNKSYFSFRKNKSKSPKSVIEKNNNQDCNKKYENVKEESDTMHEGDGDVSVSSITAVVSKNDHLFRKLNRNRTKDDNGKTKKRQSSSHKSAPKDPAITRNVNPINRIILLNNQGVDAFESRQLDCAIRLFSDARLYNSNIKHVSSGDAAAATLHSTSTRSPERLDKEQDITILEDGSNSCLISKGSEDTGTTINSVSSYIYQRNDFDEGMNTYSRPERISESCHDSELLDAILYYNTAQIHRAVNSLDTAMKCLEYALEPLRSYYSMCPPAVVIKNKSSTPIESSSSNTLSPQLMLIFILQTTGQTFYQQGELRLAIQQYKEALYISKQIFGKKHRTAASACNSLGVLYYHLLASGESNVPENVPQLALGYSERALMIRKEILGTGHADVGTVYNNIGRLYVTKDQFHKAIECYNNALHIRRQALGTDSLDYAATAFNAGQSYHQLNDGERALELYHEFLRVAVKHFTKNHRDVAVVLSGIAHIHQERGNSDEALKLYLESLEASRNALGESHPEVAMILNRIGNYHFEQENYNEAFTAYSKGLAIERQVLKSNHGNIIVTMSNLGEIHRQKGEWDEAIGVFKVVLKMQRDRYGKDHAEIATSLHVIGMTYDKKGESNLALSYLQSALLIRRKIYGEYHLDIGYTLSALGTIFSRGNKFKLALDLFNEALRIRKSLLGKHHSDVAFSFYNIALIHHKQGSYEEAIKGFTEALEIEKHVLGENHKDVAITLYKLGDTYKRHDDLTQALNFFNQALAIERLTMAIEDPLAIARTLTEIGNILLTQSNTGEAMQAFVEAARIYQSSSLSTNSVNVHGHQYGLDATFADTAPAA